MNKNVGARERGINEGEKKMTLEREYEKGKVGRKEEREDVMYLPISREILLYKNNQTSVCVSA